MSETKKHPRRLKTTFEEVKQNEVKLAHSASEKYENYLRNIVISNLGIDTSKMDIAQLTKLAKKNVKKLIGEKLPEIDLKKKVPLLNNINFESKIENKIEEKKEENCNSISSLPINSAIKEKPQEIKKLNKETNTEESLLRNLICCCGNDRKR